MGRGDECSVENLGGKELDEQMCENVSLGQVMRAIAPSGVTGYDRP